MTTSRAALEQVLRKAGIKVTSIDPDKRIERISTGSLSMDRALGGGWACGLINSIAGPESYGKTTICLQGIRWFLEHDERGVAYCDFENDLDPIWAKRNGLDMDRVAVFQGYDDDQNRLGQETLLALVVHIIQSGIAGLVVVDSLAVMKPQETGEGKKGDPEYGRVLMGQRARNFDDFFTVVSPLLKSKNVTLIVINQLRASMNAHGDPNVEPGGQAKNFSYAISVRLTKPEEITADDVLTHHVFKGYTKKNKTAARGKTFEAFFGIHSTGRVYPDIIPEMCNLGKEFRLFTNSNGEKLVNGTWYYQGEPLKNGDSVVKSMADAQRLLFDDPDFRAQIEQEIRKEIERENSYDF